MLFDAATEGGRIILAMLAVGGVFLAVILLGELTHYAGAKRKARRAARRPTY